MVFVGRANIGAISLHIPMIYMKAKEENKDFFELLDYYLQMIRRLHINRYEYLGKAKASSNPLMFCEGGYYGGNLNPDDEIKPLLKYWTASFGITALNELEVLASGHRLVDGNEFSLKVMNHIEKRINEFKEQDGWLYAIYNTPKLCGWV